MICYPKNWQKIGHEIDPSEIAVTIKTCLGKLNVRNLSLSGGIDSSLLLYFMKEMLGDPIYCYTIALDETHPDYIHAKIAAKFFGVFFHPQFIGENTEPDDIVTLFYKKLNHLGVTEIIAGDGIDEFSCGYYSHLEDRSEQNYISWIRRLNAEHLEPLNENSGKVKVYLPYLSPDVISLLSLIPLYAKVGVSCKERKKIIRYMAQGNIPEEIIDRWKYGFCDAGRIKA